MTAARMSARSRHPSSTWSANHDRLRQRLAEQLGVEGHPEPLLAAALLSLRGRLGLDRQAFCKLTGVDPTLVAAVEDGSREEMHGLRRTL